MNHTVSAGRRLLTIVAGLLLALAMLAAGCAPLQPLNLPEETSLPPAQTMYWDDLAAIRSDNWLHLLNDGNEAIDWRLRLINSASTSLDLQTFLWNNDQTGLVILRHLYEAADRGVRVRILLDDTFTATHAKVIHNIDVHPNIELRVYNPYAHRVSSIVVRELLNIGDFNRVDHRMHNKAMIVDNRAAIIGGRNLADEYFGHHGEMNFRDFEVLTAGPAIPEISRQFDEYWNNNWSYPVSMLESVKLEKEGSEFETWLMNNVKPRLKESPTTMQRAWIQATRTGISAEILVIADKPAADNPAAGENLPVQLAEELLLRAESARQELILVSAYLIPTPELERVIEQAEDRGVRVRILTNSLRSNNHAAAHSAYRHYVRRLVGHGAEVHEVRTFARDRALYMEQPVDQKHLGLHAKILIIDNDQTFIGSANLDPRSLRINTEMGLFVRSVDFNHQVRQALSIDLLQDNAWYLQLNENGKLIWNGGDTVLFDQPAESELQRLEDWFLSILPIEGEM
jgi:putative cardiolipin synthase